MDRVRDATERQLAKSDEWRTMLLRRIAHTVRVMDLVRHAGLGTNPPPWTEEDGVAEVQACAMRRSFGVSRATWRELVIVELLEHHFTGLR